MKKILILILLMQFGAAAYARMYQWVDPDTGTTQLSGKPPSWYRSTANGPRVFVFENGRLIDDTGISAPAEENERLRNIALLKAEQDVQTAMVKLQQASQQKAIMELQGRGSEQAEETMTVPSRQTPVAEQSPPEPVNTGPTAEELRALIDQYEQLRTQDARQLIETAVPGEGGGAPR
jgi:hypothetical protein